VRLSAGTPAGARVFRDDVELGSASMGLALPVEPGVHVVSVVAPGHLDGRITVATRDGETSDVVATAGPSSTRRTGAWILGAAGIASLGTGAAFGLVALQAHSASDAHCAGATCSDAASLRDYAQARSDARVADVFFGIGAVAVVVGGILMLASGSTETPRSAAVGWGNRVGFEW
jgi:hypothetical protein